MTHMAEVEDYTMNIMEAVESAAVECLPLVGGGGREASLVVPGWKEYVKPFSDENKFWHSVWLSAGKPPQGSLCEIMKESKLQYRYAIYYISCPIVKQSSRFRLRVTVIYMYTSFQQLLLWSDEQN